MLNTLLDRLFRASRVFKAMDLEIRGLHHALGSVLAAHQGEVDRALFLEAKILGLETEVAALRAQVSA